jgi:hypothetical protein
VPASEDPVSSGVFTKRLRSLVLSLTAKAGPWDRTHDGVVVALRASLAMSEGQLKREPTGQASAKIHPTWLSGPLRGEVGRPLSRRRDAVPNAEPVRELAVNLVAHHLRKSLCRGGPCGSS